jgi:glycosyltransferase involved in cell wall biosynthesis
MKGKGMQFVGPDSEDNLRKGARRGLKMSAQVAVLVPCHNEAATIKKVVREFAHALPGAAIYVYDNNSDDGTGDLAAKAGAIVRQEHRQGKGNVIRRMFADIEADIYVLVDGDDTYHAASAPQLVERLRSGPYDMVNGARRPDSATAHRRGHAFGNKLLTSLVQLVFGLGTKDMLSGYKVLSRRFVKSFPAVSSGFEIETELVVHALELRMPVSELDTLYLDRPDGSVSKLRTFRDGLRILRLIGFLVKEERPLAFFGLLALVLAGISLLTGTSVIIEFLRTGMVPRFPTAILAVGLMLSALLCFSCGIILESLTRGRREIKRLRYLSYPAP